MYIKMVEKQYKKLENGELAKYLELPEQEYSMIKTDFDTLTQYKSIDDLNLSDSDGVMVKVTNDNEGLHAAAYILKKWFDENQTIDEYDSAECHGFNAYENDELSRVPILNYEDFLSILPNNDDFGGGFGGLSFKSLKDEDDEEQYWDDQQFPIIMFVNNNFSENQFVDNFEYLRRFTVIIKNESESSFGSYEEKNNNRLSFELDFTILEIESTSDAYYYEVLKGMLKHEEIDVSDDVDGLIVIQNLKKYRHTHFDGLSDVKRLVQRLVKYNVDKTLELKDFMKILKMKVNDESEPLSPTHNLDSLIGLAEVKSELNRLLNRTKYAHERSKQTNILSKMNMAAVFMGNPGTAKTTVARLFGQKLHDESVLSTRNFVEVSRKDLIAKYVGWTAPLVQEKFQEAEGGILFIDEAYSLLEKNTSSFADEALSEIIIQMENHPETMVIFAGYPEEMKAFIREANTGLKSRLSNVIDFPDYSDQEMYKIFKYLLEKDNYKLKGETRIKKEVLRFIRQMNLYGDKNLGNGRLMRRLYHSAVGFKAERNPNEFELILLSDVKAAITQIISSEEMQLDQYDCVIGF